MSQLLKEDTIFEKAMKKYNYFTDNKDLLNEYDKREAYLFYQASLMRGSRKDGFEEGIKEGKLAGIREGKLEGIKEGIEKGIKEGKLEGIREGKLEGIKEGRHAEQISMAIAMKKDGADINLISKYTGLSIDEIRKLWPDGKKL